jgi:hypothetical protein
MRSSFRIFDSRSGEMIGGVMRTGEAEISKLSFSHNEVVQLRSELPETAGNYRVECWVGEQGGEFKAVLIDMFDVAGSYDAGTDKTTYDITAYGTFVACAPVFCINGSDEVIEGVIDEDAGDYLCVFDGDTEAYDAYFMYFIEGTKGFMSIPVVGDVVMVHQETGNREVTVRYFEEGDDV